MSSLLAKVLVWRGISIVTTAGIAWVYLGDFAAATGLTVFLHVVLTALNYVFELGWKKIEENHQGRDS